jgi:hypothetical protein
MTTSATSGREPDTPLPGSPASETAELVEEVRVSGSERATRANAAILALSRAARSFLLYDPSNDAIRRFIEDLRARMTQALAGGPLNLEVRPFELVLDTEVVYLERERERSLAFRMYRDGVRRLLISGAAEWDELLRLLEILSIRYTGVRQNEDDVVTLLWKAGFQHIEIEAVEGFIPEDDEQTTKRGSVQEINLPADWDLPVRALGPPAELAFSEVGAAEYEALRGEEASHLLPANATQATIALLQCVADPALPLSLDDVKYLIAEVRDFLLAEGQLAHVTTLIRALQTSFASAPETIAPVIATFGDRQALSKIVRSTPKSETKPPEDLIALLDLIPQDRLARIVDLLAQERGEASRRLVRQLIERYAADAPDYVATRLRSSEPGVACDLLRALARALPEKALEVALELTHHSDLSVVSEAFRRLEKAPAGPRIARVLIRMMDSPHEEIRMRVLRLLARRNEAAVFEPLVRSAEGRAPKGIPTDEAELLGQTLARLAPSAALPLFKGWLRPKGLVGRFVESPGQRLLEWIAVSGIGELPGEEAEKTLRETSAKANPDLRRHCLATLARRRHGGAPHG